MFESMWNNLSISILTCRWKVKLKSVVIMRCSMLRPGVSPFIDFRQLSLVLMFFWMLRVASVSFRMLRLGPLSLRFVPCSFCFFRCDFVYFRVLSVFFRISSVFFRVSSVSLLPLSVFLPLSFRSTSTFLPPRIVEICAVKRGVP